MQFKAIAFSFMIACGALFTGASQAETRAVVTQTVNVRSGPGPDHRVIDRLYRGERVRVERCANQRRWCYVRHRGRDGWVSSRYLHRIGGGGGGHYRPDRPERPGSICFYGAYGYICLN